MPPVADFSPVFRSRFAAAQLDSPSLATSWGFPLKEDEIARLLPIVRVSFGATCAVLLLIVMHTRRLYPRYQKGRGSSLTEWLYRSSNAAVSCAAESFGSCESCERG